MTNNETLLQKKKLAKKIIGLTQDRLVTRMPFLNRAILRMPLGFYDEGEMEYGIAEGFGTDGREVVCDPQEVLDIFKEDKDRLLRIYMHMIFHCIFYHPFQYARLNFNLWDFVTDVAVENTLMELGWKELDREGDLKRKLFVDKMRPKVEAITAENLYHYYQKHEEEADEALKLAPLFKQDCHHLWVSIYALVGKKVFDDSSAPGVAGEPLGEEWKRIGHSIQRDIEAFKRFQEDMPGSCIDNIKEVFKERYSYRKFLKKFISRQEEMKVNQEEFDYIYYTYGMNLYGNMPLVEPLEYQDSSKIHDFVIAIDVSGSCQGKVVRNFLNKTYTILKEAETFFHTFNVHIITCDTQVKSDVKITNQQEFDEYMRDLKLEGFGGTDFRPVFQHVNQLVENKEFTNLKGLLYLTDGLGTFPKSKPEYETAFIIIEDPKEKPKVPAWALKLVMGPVDLEKEN